MEIIKRDARKLTRTVSGREPEEIGTISWAVGAKTIALFTASPNVSFNYLELFEISEHLRKFEQADS